MSDNPSSKANDIQQNLPQLNQTNSQSNPQSSQGIRLPPISFLSNLHQLQNNGSGFNGSETGSNVERLSTNQSPIDSVLKNSRPSVSPDDKHPPSFQLPSSSGLSTSSSYFSDNKNNSTTHSNQLDKFKSRAPLLNDLLSGDNNAQSLARSSYAQPSAHLKSESAISESKLAQDQIDEEIISYYSKKYEIFDFTEEEKHDILQHEKRSRLEAARNPNYKPFLCYSIIKRLNTVKPAKKVEEVSKEKMENSQEEAKKPEEQEKNEKRDVETREEEKPRKKFIKREVIIHNDEVLKCSSKFPTKHIGSLIYTPYPTRSSYKQLSILEKDRSSRDEEENKEQFTTDEIVPLLPKLRDYINCIVTVRISSFHLTDIRNNPHYNKRSIWGTDIYTDDSDILLILKHNGFLPVIDEAIEIEKEKRDTKQTPGNLKNTQNISQSVKNFRQFINIIGGDIHVDLIILPTLEKYQGLYRHGINSRSWLTGHDGVSIALYGVRYGEKNSAVESVNNSEVKKAKIRDFLALSDDSRYESTGDNGWKLSYKAWKAAKERKDGE